MVDYRTDEPHGHTTKRRGAGFTIGLLLLVAALLVALLFATGFWSADVTESGALPTVSVDGGALPQVDLDSKEVVVGTTPTKIEVPKVETTTTTVDVPTIGVKSDKK